MSEAGQNVVDEARGLLDRVDAGAELDAAEVEAWSARLRREADGMARDDLTFCAEVLGALSEQVKLQLSQVDRELERVQRSRRGLRSYAHLRSQKVQQRLNRRV